MSKQTVKLKPVEAGDGKPFHWKVKHDGKEGSNLPGENGYPKVDLKKDSGPNLITFTIEGNNNYTFSSDPIWIQKGQAKPTGGVDEQIAVAPQLFNSGKTLVVVDWNTWAGDLTYQLNIDNAPAPVDPVITNGGGGNMEDPAPPPGFQPPGDSGLVDLSSAAFWILMGAVLLASLIGAFIGVKLSR